VTASPILDAVLSAIDDEFVDLMARRDVAHPDNHTTFADYLRHLAAGERAAAELYTRHVDTQPADAPHRIIVVAGLRAAAVLCHQRAAMYDQAADRNPEAGPDDDTWKA
jgi:hypothetical protein